MNVSKLKQGPVTLARLFCAGGKYALHAVNGVAEAPPAWEEAGWAPPAPQLPSLHIKMDDPEAFLQQIAGQHYIITYGDQMPLLRDLCNILEIELV